MYMFYGKNYDKFCNYMTGECDTIDTSLGNELDDYTIVYADDSLTNFDYSHSNNNIYLFWPYTGTYREKTFIAPNNSNITVFCLDGRYMWVCNGNTFDFTHSNNVVFVANRMSNSGLFI